MGDMKKAIIVLGAGPMQIPALRIAKDLGLFVIAADRNQHAPGFFYADLPLPIDIKNYMALADWAAAHQQEYCISAVFTGADVAVSAAAINERLGLSGISSRAALASNNKSLMKKAWLADGIPTPFSVEVRDWREAQAVAKGIGYPLIVKAVDNSASRGTRIVEFSSDLQSAVEDAQRYSSTGTCLIEELAIGEEQSVETIMHEGKQLRAGIVDRHYGFYPFPIEVGHTNPTRLSEAVQEMIYGVVEQAALSLGITDGPAKADMILTKQGPKILEMPARLSGGFHSQYTTPLATGMNPIRAVIRKSIGDRGFASDLQWTKHDFASCQAFFPSPGRITRIDGLEKARGIKGVHEIFFYKKEGDIIDDYRNCADRPCYVIASAGSREELGDIFSEVRETLLFQMEHNG